MVYYMLIFIPTAYDQMIEGIVRVECMHLWEEMTLQFTVPDFVPVTLLRLFNLESAVLPTPLTPTWLLHWTWQWPCNGYDIVFPEEESWQPLLTGGHRIDVGLALYWKLVRKDTSALPWNVRLKITQRRLVGLSRSARPTWPPACFSASLYGPDWPHGDQVGLTGSVGTILVKAVHEEVSEIPSFLLFHQMVHPVSLVTQQLTHLLGTYI